MEHNSSLWPLFSVDRVRLPQDLLNEQAGELKNATNNLLEAKVDYSVTNDPWELHDILKFGINNLSKASFYIIAPVLSDYRFRLFFAILSKLEIYPILIMSDLVDIRKVIYTEQELQDVLSLIFKSEETKQIIETLMIQSLQEMSVL